MMMKLLRGLMGNIYTNYKVDLATNTNPVILYTVPDRYRLLLNLLELVMTQDLAAQLQQPLQMQQMWSLV